MQTPETVISDSPITSSSPPQKEMYISPELRSVDYDISFNNEMVLQEEPLTHLDFNLTQSTLSGSVLQLDSACSADEGSERSSDCDHCLCMYHTGDPSDYPDFCVFKCEKCEKTVCKRCLQKFECHDYQKNRTFNGFDHLETDSEILA